MDLEKLQARSRATLLAVSLIGVLLATIGVAMTVVVLNHAVSKNGASPNDWVGAITSAGGPMTLAAIGFLLACMPWGLLTVTSLMFRRAIDSRYRGEQLLGTLENHR